VRGCGAHAAAGNHSGVQTCKLIYSLAINRQWTSWSTLCGRSAGGHSRAVFESALVCLQQALIFQQ